MTTLLHAEPALFVTDLEAALAFWARLGFAELFRYGTPPFYAAVARDNAHLSLRHVDRVPFDAAFRREVPDALSATITLDGALDDADALARDFAAAGIPFHQPPRTEPWGARTFILADPDGNLILFAGRGA